MGSRDLVPPSLIYVLYRGGELHALTVLPPRKESRYPSCRRMGGLRVGLDKAEKRKSMPLKKTLFYFIKL
jgi:hypothetical protein